MSKGEAGAFLLKAVSRLENEGNRSSSIAGYVKTLKGWWRFNGVEVTWQVRYQRDVGLYDYERVPTLQDLHSILEHADLQKKVCCALMAFSGLRPGVLGKRDSNDGLRVSDLPEMVVKREEGAVTVEFLKVPMVVAVRRILSKSGRQYISFLPEQGCNYVKQYLEWRAQTLQEEIGASSPVVTANPHNPHYPHCIGRFVRTCNVSDSLRLAIRAAGFGWRPYVLRR